MRLSANDFGQEANSMTGPSLERVAVAGTCVLCYQFG